jgi:hypothetical protein
MSPSLKPLLEVLGPSGQTFLKVHLIAIEEMRIRWEISVALHYCCIEITYLLSICGPLANLSKRQ